MKVDGRKYVLSCYEGKGPRVVSGQRDRGTQTSRTRELSLKGRTVERQDLGRKKFRVEFIRE